MTLILKQFFNFLKLLNSETGTNQIAAGVACGLILGLTPAFSLQTVLVLLVIFFFRVQAGAAFGSAFFFAIPAYLLDGLFDEVGQKVLEMDALRPLFTELYHLPLVPFTRFNNSVVMGSGVVALVLVPVVFLGSRVLVVKYREKVVARFSNTKFWKAVKATSFYKWYATYEQLAG